MIQQQRRTLKGLIVCGILSMVSQPAIGVTTAKVTVKVTVMTPPPCIINNNRAITVEFSEVTTNRVNGLNYLKPVDYSLDCQGAFSNALKMQLIGSGADFDSTILKSNKTGLGIKILQSSTQLPINTWLNFNYLNKPALSAVPVKQDGVTLTAGEFSASATMKISYQ